MRKRAHRDTACLAASWVRRASQGYIRRRPRARGILARKAHTGAAVEAPTLYIMWLVFTTAHASASLGRPLSRCTADKSLCIRRCAARLVVRTSIDDRRAVHLSRYELQDARAQRAHGQHAEKCAVGETERQAGAIRRTHVELAVLRSLLPRCAHFKIE